MINYIKNNHLSLLIVLWLVVSSALGSSSKGLLGGITVSENGKDVVNFTNPVHFNTTVTADATSTISSQGTPAYYTRGGVDYADVQVTLSATSSIPAIIVNPFGTATSTLTACMVQVTANGIAVANNFDISTTSSAGSYYGSSTPAIVANALLGTGLSTKPCALNTATTSVATAPGATTGNPSILPGRTVAGESTYIIGPSEALVMRIATATPGTFTSYLTGTFSATFMKP